MPIAPDSLPDFLYGTAWKEDRTETLTEMALVQASAGLIPPTSDATITKLALVKRCLPHITPESSLAQIFFYKVNLPIRTGRTTGFRTIPKPACLSRLPSR